MKTTAIFQLPFSSGSAWDEVHRRHPSILSLVTFIVLPLALIPPVMLYYAGTHYGDAFLPGFGEKSWRFITTIFFLAELLTFAAMGWMIHEVANSRNLPVSATDAYRLAALAPIPLWLSAFGLLIPSFGVNVVISLAALGLSISIVYHGLQGLAQRHEEVEAMSVTHTIMGASVMAWVLLLALIWAF
ncbi:Yip1 family protein [Thiohalomonas denitrificans]|uniref:Yip1 family protein n=1 Tax=Thiohalomonas denitrificans TaxID=415747 RepID=UPI0026EF32A6|nr:Yip1 family protein [Thiohalomonas denitrificans]